jgi:membrane protein
MTKPFGVFGRAGREFGTDHCTLLAASIAYHVLFAFIPLVTLLIAILGFVLRDPAAQQGAVDRVLQLLPMQPGAGNDSLVLSTIRTVSQQTAALSLIGLLGLIWSSAGILGSVRASLNIVWDSQTHRGFLASALRDVGGVIGLGLLFVLSLGGTIFVHALTSNLISSSILGGVGLGAAALIGYALPALLSWLAFTVLYRYVPDVDHQASNVIGGALLAAVLFEVLKHGFAWYVSHFSRYQTLYGALGGVMLFMLWTYLSALVMLLGAEVAAESERVGGRPEPRREVAFSHS